MVLGVVAGYVVVVATSLLGTLALSMSFPKFAVSNHRIRSQYKLVHELIWMTCTITGAYVTAMIAKAVHPYLTELALTAALIGILWWNSWEAKQRGIAHQILITILTVVGVSAGYLLEAATNLNA